MVSLPTLRVPSTTVGLLLGRAAVATPQEFVINPAYPYATFEVNDFGVSTQRGRLGNAAGTAVLDGVQGEGTLSITLEARSSSTGDELMEKLLRASRWFAVEQYPAITLDATSITFLAQKPSESKAC